MDAAGWFMLGAPWDCSGSARGEQAAPHAFREAGLSAVVGRDVGDAVTVIDRTDRDERAGVIALSETVRAAHALADDLAVAMTDLPGRRPLVVGRLPQSWPAQATGLWLHLDLDVLDPESLDA
ncbi:hypothetical protein [Rhodococcus opacus]|uniref:hypothetical protein n=1 Tax=Rhodococcus opacus TaxID=37919 RepID=UPI000ACF0F5B|nr:hypothetical protein [Rhodococcus opacus]